LDLTLPDKSGTELIADVIAISADCPVIVLTGYSNAAFGIKSLSLGISDYLLKDELSSPPLYKSILYSIERKKTLNRLEESEKRYSDLFHLSPLPMWVFDLETLHFMYVNTAAVKNFGYSQEEFLSMTIKDIRPVEDIPLMQDIVAKSLQFDKDYLHGPIRHLKKNGDIIYVDMQSNTIQFNGKLARLILAIDVTEKFKHVEAIEKQNEKLKEIAWIQSHVVRAPLARIMGIANLINDIKTESAECNALLAHLLRSCNELDVIIRDIANKSHDANI
jgi:PAS domain S-box-containing protein